MKILFLLPYPIDEAPSQRFRFEQYFEVLKVNGFELKTQSFWSLKVWLVLYKPGHFLPKLVGFFAGVLRRIIILLSVSSYDFIFIHRECAPLGPPVFEWLIAKVFNKKIVYDFDDSIWLPNTSAENNIIGFIKWHGKVSSICKWSHKISCGNSFLATFALQYNKNVIVNPTTVDTVNLHNPSHYTPQKEIASIVIGWTGTQSTLPYIISLIPMFKILLEKFSGQVRLLIIANKDPELNLNFVDFIPWSKQTEVQDLLKIDIGIMPLSDDIWAKGKCGFKALQYMALEIPALVSPVGVNTEIVDNGINGHWCTTEDDWIDSLEKIIADKDLRKKMGIAGRKKVIEHYSVSSNSSAFLGLFS